MEQHYVVYCHQEYQAKRHRFTKWSNIIFMCIHSFENFFRRIEQFFEKIVELVLSLGEQKAKNSRHRHCTLHCIHMYIDIPTRVFFVTDD